MTDLRLLSELKAEAKLEILDFKFSVFAVEWLHVPLSLCDHFNFSMSLKFGNSVIMSPLTF